eukprot:gene15472-17050_t
MWKWVLNERIGDTITWEDIRDMMKEIQREDIAEVLDEFMKEYSKRQKRSRRVPAITVTDLAFADDIALLSEEIEQAQRLIDRLETEAAKVGLHCNSKKTEYMSFNQTVISQIRAQDGNTIKEVESLGSWTQSSEKDIAARKAVAWSACHKLRKIWTSKLPRTIKVRLFRATVESVLLYGSETWTITTTMTKRLDGCYTRMLRMAANVSWRDHVANIELYGDLPRLSQTVQQRRVRLAGHCIRHDEEVASSLVLWLATNRRNGE